MPTDNPSTTGSLLERVLKSQQTDTLEHFNPTDIVTELLKQLSPKEADVVRRRFGLQTGTPETLEAIGASYQVTRERVRQIQRWAIGRLLKSPASRQLLHGLDIVLRQLIEDHGGVVVEDELLQHLHSHVTSLPNVRSTTLFLLEELMSEKYQRVLDVRHKAYWRLRYVTPETMDTVIAAAAEVLGQAGKPLAQAELLARVAASPAVKAITPSPSEQMLLAYLSVATEIERNPFDDFGLREWGSIVPKRMNDKILLVLRKHGQPMHFQDITKRINEIGFDHRQAYPPTVHNELILNKEYVLVGRGIYALREWGYKPGVVADVIRDIITEAGRPLIREEIVAKVLARRMVKKNTVHLALTNKKLFRRQPDGGYVLAESTSS